jgi:Tol biopolymer transport system component
MKGVKGVQGPYVAPPGWQAIALCCLGLLTQPAGADELKHPDWHPNGSLLIAEGSCFGGTDLFLIDLDNGTVSMAWDGGEKEGYPRWFTDGERLAFHQIDDAGKARIYLARVDNQQVIGHPRRLTSGPFDIEPAPSPAGQSIAYSQPATEGMDIALLDIATRKQTRYWPTAPSENFSSWNPDGKSLIFHARGDTGTQIFQRDRRSGALLQLTDGPGPNMVANMSSDGLLLAYASERSGDREIYIRRLEDNTDTRITDRPGRDGYPKFSPDNQQLAFHSVIDEQHTVVRVINIASGHVAEYSCGMAEKP